MFSCHVHLHGRGVTCFIWPPHSWWVHREAHRNKRPHGKASVCYSLFSPKSKNSGLPSTSAFSCVWLVPNDGPDHDPKKFLISCQRLKIVVFTLKSVSLQQLGPIPTWQWLPKLNSNCFRGHLSSWIHTAPTAPWHCPFWSQESAAIGHSLHHFLLQWVSFLRWCCLPGLGGHLSLLPPSYTALCAPGPGALNPSHTASMPAPRPPWPSPCDVFCQLGRVRGVELDCEGKIPGAAWEEMGEISEKPHHPSGWPRCTTLWAIFQSLLLSVIWRKSNQGAWNNSPTWQVRRVKSVVKDLWASSAQEGRKKAKVSARHS